jgi:transposase InsO family protein
LLDQSRAPKHHPNGVPREVEEEIVKLRGKKMKRGPLKLLAKLRQTHPHLTLPCASTVAEILKRKGLSAPRRRRNHATPSAQPLSSAIVANDIWCVDFKGWFLCENGQRCDPLTISDASSRYLLRCQAMTGSTSFECVRPLFEATFREYGLPLAIHSDNGPPFATVGLAGLSRLSVWWIRLGIRPDRSRPGKPQDNGRHERMHRTLKEEAISPPAANARQQQLAFDFFREEYNEERPHQALGQKPPALFYAPSPRPYPSRLAPVEYRDDWERRKIKDSGRMKWKGKEIVVCQALTGEQVGLEPIDDGVWRIHFCQYPVGIFNEKRMRVMPLPKKKKK